MSTLFCAMLCSLALALAAQKFQEQSYIFKALAPPEQSSKAEQEKACTTIGIGLDILEQLSKKVVDQYIDKFNDN